MNIETYLLERKIQNDKTIFFLNPVRINVVVSLPANAPGVQCIFDKIISYSMKVLWSTIRLQSARSNVTTSEHSLKKDCRYILYSCIQSLRWEEWKYS